MEPPLHYAIYRTARLADNHFSAAPFCQALVTILVYYTGAGITTAVG